MAEQIQRPMRSWLFIPAIRPEWFSSAIASGTDVIIIDMEYSVASVDKVMARSNAVSLIFSHYPRTLPIALRINALDTPEGIDDLCTLFDFGVFPDFLILPKTESADHIKILDRLLTAIGVETSLIAVIESLQGLNMVETITKASPRLRGLMSSTVARTTRDFMCLSSHRMISACTASGITAIHTPYFDIHDIDGLEAETCKAITDGFTAKAAIHPAQISIINTLFNIVA
ncbi:CoA ester lyase [Salmonella enterica subsp. salamae]|nr:CoA ester lyase [Salmonella enterica subsp. salamae]EDW4021212.1 CoA ester lyase [Salmonella enterica subsp. salamae]